LCPRPFFVKINSKLFFRGKSRPKRLVAFVIFKKSPIENYRVIGENSPDLVTLVLVSAWVLRSQPEEKLLFVQFRDGRRQRERQLYKTTARQKNRALSDGLAQGDQICL
jgi:hypothetical protein